ncbi:hypothetical protein C943_01343 [Mariniradius saccharolyticus AK6]|uniref:Uncharacterized protein n=1 Tax=Mariniradius saccharolyticus AK6 TaxID=1239962 RepID=M7Y496_9BACT|nr:hypothetical protein C943_01343 [Mariniradius saccharolyticus AK6]
MPIQGKKLIFKEKSILETNRIGNSERTFFRNRADKPQAKSFFLFFLQTPIKLKLYFVDVESR